MERKKSFLVVCVWLILGIVARTQELRTGKSRLFPGVQAMTPWGKLRLPQENLMASGLERRQALGHILSEGSESGGTVNGGFSQELRPVLIWDRIVPGSRRRPAFAVRGLDLRDGHVLPDDYYTRHIGFFCRKEALFEKTTRIPLRLRLGSLESCNRLEGK